MITRRTFLKHTTTAGLGAALAAAGIRSSAEAADSAAGGFRYAVCNETFQDWPLEKACALAAECGYKALEIAPFTFNNDVRKISAQQRTEIARTIEKAGLKTIGLHWLLAKTEGFHITSPDAEVRRNTVAYLGELARFCADLGGTVLVFGSPQQRNLIKGVSAQQALQYATEVFQAIVPSLEKTGTILALEPLSPKTTTFLTTAAEAVELAERGASPRCRLHLDCRAMSTEPTPIPDLLRKYRTWLEHFHANDINGQGPGFGQLDFVPIFRTLKEIDYRGWVSVEVFNYQPGPDRLARESIAYMRKCEASL